MGIWIGIFFFISAIVAAYFCRVDVIVEGTGKLVSLEQNIVMKPLDRTVIKSIDVKVGELVKKNQLLITFDPTINRAEEERLRSELQSYQAQYSRWNAEFLERDYKRSANAAQDERWQAAIFSQRKKFYEEKVRYYDGAVKRIEANIASTRETVAKQKERFKALDEISAMYESLHKKNAASKKELLEIRMQRMQLDADIARLENSVREAEHERDSTAASKQTFIMEWKKDISEQMVQAERNLTTTKKSMDKVLQLNRYVFLRAPCDAIVHEIASFPVGSAVREAEPLITLVPINCEIELEAEIPARDIGRVKVGDKVRIKLNAFPFQKHGTLDGVVRNISEDTFQRQQTHEAENSTYYRARITLSGKLRSLHTKFRLIPGMEAQAEIKVGTRSVLEYIAYPLIKSLDEAIREP